MWGELAPAAQVFLLVAFFFATENMFIRICKACVAQLGLDQDRKLQELRQEVRQLKAQQRMLDKVENLTEYFRLDRTIHKKEEQCNAMRRQQFSRKVPTEVLISTVPSIVWNMLGVLAVVFSMPVTVFYTPLDLFGPLVNGMGRVSWALICRRTLGLVRAALSRQPPPDL
eukprot:m.57474 g.57474  ORF g.57474 m.57474 type:complete len:170 (-) comp15804_c0_seq3:65-574(-)